MPLTDEEKQQYFDSSDDTGNNGAYDAYGPNVSNEMLAEEPEYIDPNPPGESYWDDETSADFHAYMNYEDPDEGNDRRFWGPEQVNRYYAQIMAHDFDAPDNGYLDNQGIATAYDAYVRANPGKTPDQWTDNDETRAITANLKTPPVEFVPDNEKHKATWSIYDQQMQAKGYAPVNEAEIAPEVKQKYLQDQPAETLGTGKFYLPQNIAPATGTEKMQPGEFKPQNIADAANQFISGIPAEQYNKLLPMQRMYASLYNQVGNIMAANMGLGAYKAVSNVAGPVIAVPVGVGIAAFAKYANETNDDGTYKHEWAQPVFQILNWAWDNAERAGGFAMQALVVPEALMQGKPEIAKETLKELASGFEIREGGKDQGEVTGMPYLSGPAMEAGRLAAESMFSIYDKYGNLVTRDLTSPDLKKTKMAHPQGDMAITDAQAEALLMNPTMDLFSKEGKTTYDQGYRLSIVDNNLLTAARKEIANGASADEVLKKYSAMKGFPGQFQDLAASILLDPSNKMVEDATKATGKIAEATGHTTLAKAAEMATGPVSLTQEYGRLARTELDANQRAAVAKNPIARWAAGFDKFGELSDYAQPHEAFTDANGKPVKGFAKFTNPLDYLRGLDRQSRANALLHNGMDGIIQTMNMNDPKDFDGRVNSVMRLMGVTPDQTVESLNKSGLPLYAGSAEFQHVPTILRDMRKGIEDIQTQYHSFDGDRKVLTKIAEGLGIDPYTLVNELHNSVDGKAAEVRYRQFVDVVADRAAVENNLDPVQFRKQLDTAKTPDEIAKAIPQGQAGTLLKSLLLDESGAPLTGKKLKIMADKFVGEAAPGIGLTPEMASARLQIMLEDGLSKAAAKYFGVAPSNAVMRMFNLAKRAQSIALLGQNPTNFVNNALNNYATLSWDMGLGKLLSTDMKTVDDFFERTGAISSRVKEGGLYESEYGQKGNAITEARKDPNNGLIQKATDAVNKVGQSWFAPFTKFSRKEEAKARRLAAYHGASEFINRMWVAGKGFTKVEKFDPSLKKLLESTGVDIERLHKAIEGSRNRQEALSRVADLLGGEERAGVHDVWTPDEIELIRKTNPTAYDELEKAIAGGDIDGGIKAYSEVVKEAIRNQLEEDSFNTIHGAMLTSSAGGAVGLADYLSGMDVDYANALYTHRDFTADVALRAKGAPDYESRAAIWRQGMREASETWGTNKRNWAAQYLGLLRGMGDLDPQEAEIMKTVDAIYKNEDAFYYSRQELFDEHNLTKWANDVERDADYQRIVTQLNQEYADMLIEESRLQIQLDNQLKDRYLQSVTNPAEAKVLGGQFDIWQGMKQLLRQKRGEQELLFRTGEIPQDVLTEFGDLVPKEMKDRILQLRGMKDGKETFYNEIYRAGIAEMVDTNNKYAPGRTQITPNKAAEVEAMAKPFQDKKSVERSRSEVRKIAHDVANINNDRQLMSVVRKYLDPDLQSLNDITPDMIRQALSNRELAHRAPLDSMDRNAFMQGLQKAYNLTPEQLKPIMVVQDAIAKYMAEQKGVTTDDIFKAGFAEISRGLSEGLQQANNTELIDQAKSRFGVRNDLKHDTYINPDGTALDINAHYDTEILTGENTSYSYGKQTGAIRWVYQPTKSEVGINFLQYRISPEQLDVIIKNAEGVPNVSVEFPNGDWEMLHNPSREDLLSRIDNGFQKLHQSAKGSIDFLSDGRAVLKGMESADVSTAIHETGHAWLRMAPDADRAIVTKWLKDEYGKELPDDWMMRDYTNNPDLIDAHEKWARAMERYFREGIAPATATKKLIAAFDKIKEWMTQIYREITGSQIDVRINPDLKAMLDTWMTGKRVEPDPVQVVAEKVMEMVDPKTPDWMAVPEITNSMLLKLWDRGYTQNEIHNMTPKQVWELLKSESESSPVPKRLIITKENRPILKAPEIPELSKPIEAWEPESLADYEFNKVDRKTWQYINRNNKRVFEIISRRDEYIINYGDSENKMREIAFYSNLNDAKEAVRTIIETSKNPSATPVIPPALTTSAPKEPEMPKPQTSSVTQDTYKSLKSGDALYLNGEKHVVTGITDSGFTAKKDGETKPSHYLADEIEMFDSIDTNNVYDPMENYISRHVQIGDKLYTKKSAEIEIKKLQSRYRDTYSNFQLSNPTSDGKYLIYADVTEIPSRTKPPSSNPNLQAKAKPAIPPELTKPATPEVKAEVKKIRDEAKATVESRPDIEKPAAKLEDIEGVKVEQQVSPADVGLPPMPQRPDSRIRKSVPKSGFTKAEIDYIASQIEGWVKQQDFTKDIETRKKIAAVYRDKKLSSTKSSQLISELKSQYEPHEPLVINVPGGNRLTFTGLGVVDAYKFLTGKKLEGFDDIVYKPTENGRTLFQAPEWNSETFTNYVNLLIKVNDPVKLMQAVREEPVSNRAKLLDAVGRLAPELATPVWLAMDKTGELWNDRISGHTRSLLQEMKPGEKLDGQSVPVGTVDSLMDMPKGQGMIELYTSQVRPVLEKLNKLKDFKPMIGVNVDPKLRAGIMDYMQNVERERADVNMGAIKHGDIKADFAMLNYGRQANWDNLLNTVMPYHFWSTRSIGNWALRAIEKPKIFADYMRLMNFAQSQTQEREGFPYRLKGKVGMHLPFLPEGFQDIYWDPAKQVFPFLQITKPWEEYLTDANRENKRAQTIIQDMVDDGQLTQQEADKAVQSMQGDTWNKAISQARMELQTDTSNPLEFAQSISGFSLPVSIATALATGRTDKLGMLPATRLLKNITAAAGYDNYKGLDLSIKGLGGDTYQEGRIKSMLANMVANGEITLDEFNNALLTNSGDAYTKATQKVAYMNLVKTLTPGLGVDFFPEGEQKARAMQSAYKKEAIPAYMSGDTKAKSAFFDANPGLSARYASFEKDPEKLKIRLLENEVKDAYYGLPELYKKQAREQLGTVFTDWLNPATQSQLSAATYAGWAQALGKIVPKELGAANTPVKFADKATAAKVQDFYDKKKKVFPWLEQAWKQVNQFPDGDPRRQAILQSSKFQSVFAWENAYKASHPDIIPFLLDANDKLFGVDPKIAAQVYEYEAVKYGKFPKQDNTGKFSEWQNSYLAKHPAIIPYVLGENNELKGVKPQVAAYVYQYRATRDKMFPGLLDNWDAAPQAEKSKYMAFQKQMAGAYPEAAPYIVSENTIRKALGQPTVPYNPIDISKMDPEMYEQYQDWIYSGEPLGAGGRAQLMRLWKEAGSPEGDFEKYLKRLRGH